MSTDWPNVRLHVVTGKGGTGKSTVAASLALALASQGKDVLLCEVEGRQGIARMFDVDPLPYAERRIATGLRTNGPPGVVHALHIDAEAALHGVPRRCTTGSAGPAGPWTGSGSSSSRPPSPRACATCCSPARSTRRCSATAATRGRSSTTPSCSTRRRPAGSRPFLHVSDELAGLAKVGPIKKQADTMMTLFRSPRTAVHFVTVLEEMPVQETADGIAHLREAGLPVGGVVVNQVRPRDLRVKDVAAARKGELDRTAIGSDLVTAGVDVSDELLDGLLDEARDHAIRRALEDAQRKLVKGMGVPSYELPRLAAGIDLGGLYELAGDLRDQGMA